jgi:hypothetical protein
LKRIFFRDRRRRRRRTEILSGKRKCTGGNEMHTLLNQQQCVGKYGLLSECVYWVYNDGYDSTIILGFLPA